MRAQACCALGFIGAVFLLALLTGAVVERFARLPEVAERQVWIGTLTLLLSWAMASLCLLAFILSYRYVRQARERLGLLGSPLPESEP